MNGPAPRLDLPPILRIGEWRFDHTRNELARGDVVRRLPRREVELLLRLAATAGETLSREQLIADVWTRRMVNDEVLSRAIADLRQALEDDAREPRYIETIPKVGYRLVASVGPGDEADREGRASDTPAAATSAPSARPAWRRHLVPLIVALLVIAAAAGTWRLRGRSTIADPLRVENLLRAQPLTSDPGWELTPRFTPDGRSVLYAKVDSPEAETTAIWIRAVDGSGARTLVDDGFGDICPASSPDGTRLAWLRYDSKGCKLVARAFLGGEVRELATCASSVRSCPDWAPDGGALVFTGPAAAPDRGLPLTRVTLASLAIEPVTGDAAAGMIDAAPRYSPDGREIAFQRGSGWGGRYHVVAASGGSPRALGTRTDLNYGLAWAGDGRRLLLATDAVGYRALVEQDAAGGPMRLLGARGARFPDISRAGAMVWEHAEYDANLWLVEFGAAPGSARQLTTARRYDAQPEFSPDGKTIAFQSNRDGFERIYLHELGTGTERAVATPGKGRWSQVAWSPDGTRLTATGYDGQVANGCVHTLASAQTDCPEALRGAESVRIAVDGSFLLLKGSELGRELWRVASGDGKATQVSSEVGRFVVAGERLVMQRRAQPGLVVREADGSEHAMAVEFGDLQRGLWSATTQSLYVGSSSSSLLQGPGIYRLPFTDPVPERVSTELPDTIGPAISISPDERTAVLGKTDRLDVDLHWVPPPG